MHTPNTIALDALASPPETPMMPAVPSTDARARPTRSRLPRPEPGKIHGPFEPTEGIVLGPTSRRWIRKDLRRDLLQLERAATLLDDGQVRSSLNHLLADSEGPLPALLARRSGIDFLLALDGIEVWTPEGSGRDPQRRAWIRFREGEEADTQLLIERAWSSLVMAAWRERRKDAKAAGLRSPKAPFLPVWIEGDDGKPAKTLLVREGASWGSLVYSTPSKAKEIHRINKAISKSKTWEEFKRRMPRDEYLELLPEIMRRLEEEGELRWDEDAGESMPTEPTGRFKDDMIPGYADGDYPRWLQTTMHLDLPDEIVRDFGSWEDTKLNGDFLEIKVADRLAVGRRLAAQGIRVLDGSRLSFS